VKDRREKWMRARIRFIAVVFAVFFLATSARAFYLQVIQREQLEKIAERQHQKTVQLTPARGTIYDSNNAALAVSVEMDSCFAEPRNIENPRQTAASLAPLLQMPLSQLEQKLTGRILTGLPS
jgi:cell division protein FtsI (penicillin-binding protein 3)